MEKEKKRELVKSDFRTFGPIGFQKFWLEKQGYMPQESLLERFIKQGFNKNLSVVAVTIEDDKITIGMPEDRFGLLRSQIKDRNIEGYEIRCIGDNLIIVISNSSVLYLINGQTVHTKEDGRLVKHLVVGANDIPQNISLRDTIDFCKEQGYLQFLMNVGQADSELMEIYHEVAKDCDGIVIHDASYVLPSFLRNFPKVGKYNRGANKKAGKFAIEHKKLGIGISSAHRIEDIGRATFDFFSDKINPDIRYSSEKAFLRDLKSDITNGGINRLNYENPLTWMGWVYQLSKYGGVPDRFKGERSSYN